MVDNTLETPVKQKNSTHLLIPLQPSYQNDYSPNRATARSDTLRLNYQITFRIDSPKRFIEIDYIVIHTESIICNKLVSMLKMMFSLTIDPPV